MYNSGQKSEMIISIYLFSTSQQTEICTKKVSLCTKLCKLLFFTYRLKVRFFFVYLRLV